MTKIGRLSLMLRVYGDGQWETSYLQPAQEQHTFRPLGAPVSQSNANSKRLT